MVLVDQEFTIHEIDRLVTLQLSPEVPDGTSAMKQPAGGPIVPSEETPVWTGSPSQWLNVGWFVGCVIGVLGFVAASVVLAQPLVAVGAAIPVIVAITKAITVRTTRIDVTTERITTTVGIFSRRKWDLELYRVKDTTLSEPFLLRLVGRANIEIVSSDRTSPLVSLRALPNAEWLRQQIRSNVERLRLQRGVREMDMDIEH